MSNQPVPCIACRSRSFLNARWTSRLPFLLTLLLLLAGQALNAQTWTGAINAGSVVPDAFDCTQLGDNPVVLTVDDGYGNTASCPDNIAVQWWNR